MSGINAIETKTYDPLLYLTPLPFTGRFYPHGFPVDVASDMREVLDAARESWGGDKQRFDKPPVRMHVLAMGEGEGIPPSPVFRGQGNMIMWVSDRENF